MGLSLSRDLLEDECALPCGGRHVVGSSEWVVTVQLPYRESDPGVLRIRGETEQVHDLHVVLDRRAGGNRDRQGRARRASFVLVSAGYEIVECDGIQHKRPMHLRRTRVRDDQPHSGIGFVRPRNLHLEGSDNGYLIVVKRGDTKVRRIGEHGFPERHKGRSSEIIEYMVNAPVQYETGESNRFG